MTDFGLMTGVCVEVNFVINVEWNGRVALVTYGMREICITGQNKWLIERQYILWLDKKDNAEFKR